MRFNSYGEETVRLAVALSNNPPASLPQLIERCVAHGLVIDMPTGPDDLPKTLAFLDEWLKVVDTPEPAERAGLLNDLLREAASYPRLTDHSCDGWHIHYRDAELPLASVLRTLICVGTALHLTGRGMHRLGRCAAQGCTFAYADVSRTGRQRFCSPACGNRDAVRRHRERSRTSMTG
jgi:predicted RNA-binding Zn ribbon-like protein